MQAVRNTFTFATMGHGMGGGGGSRGGESARRADRCCWRCYLCFVGVQHAAFGVFTTVFIVAVAASSLSLSLSLLPLAPCHMPHAPTCPNGKQIYALCSKNLYGMQVPQLVAGKRSKKIETNKTIEKYVRENAASFDFDTDSIAMRPWSIQNTPSTPTHTSLRNWPIADRRRWTLHI